MIIPFVNWGWKRKNNVDCSFNFNIFERTKEFTETSREYDSRLSQFESILNEDQYKVYMDLRNCANRLILVKDRMDFMQENMPNITKKK